MNLLLDTHIAIWALNDIVEFKSWAAEETAARYLWGTDCHSPSERTGASQ